VAEKHGFQDFYKKRQTFFFVVFAEHIDFNFQYNFFSFPHLTQIRSGVCDTEKLSQITLIKRAKSILQLQKYQNVNKVHLGVISMI